jgi:hypothetical protein
MKPELLHILQHSLGVDQYGQGQQYRNHYAIGQECDTFSLCVELAGMGFMEDTGKVAMWGGLHGFIVTDAGRRAMSEASPLPAKLSRSQKL